MVTQNHKAKLVLKTPRLEDKKVKKTESIPTGNNVTQLKQKASVTMPTSQFKSNNYTYNEQYVNKLENFKIRETQGNNGWCAGYTMSALLNATYNTNKYHAEAVMRFYTQTYKVNNSNLLV